MDNYIIGINMEIEMIFKIGGIGIIIAVVNIILSKAGREEYVMLVTLAGVVIVTTMIAKEISELFVSLKKLFEL